MSLIETNTTSFLQDLATAARKLRNLFDSRARESGMTFARARLILHLERKSGANQAELAEAIEVERPTIARLIDGLEKVGVVVRAPAENDRRARVVTLTDAGRTQATNLVELADRLREDALDGIDPADLQAAQRVVAKILSNLAAIACDE